MISILILGLAAAQVARADAAPGAVERWVEPGDAEGADTLQDLVKTLGGTSLRQLVVERAGSRAYELGELLEARLERTARISRRIGRMAPRIRPPGAPTGGDDRLAAGDRAVRTCAALASAALPRLEQASSSGFRELARLGAEAEACARDLAAAQAALGAVDAPTSPVADYRAQLRVFSADVLSVVQVVLAAGAMEILEGNELAARR
jgi:hypothetical protein